MSPQLEERLRHALRQEAETVQAPPGAWEGIRARIQPGRQRRLARPGVLVAVAAVVLVAVALAATLRGDDANRLEVTAGPGRLFVAPSAVDGFRLVYAVIDPPERGSPGPVGGMRVFGRRAGDGVALSASAVVKVPGEQPSGEPEEGRLRVGETDLVVYRDDLGRRSVTWPGDDATSVTVSTFGLDDDELAALVASLRSGSALQVQPALPSGFSEVSRTALPMEPFPLTDQSWQSDAGPSFSVTVVDVPGVTLDMVAGELPGGRAVPVRGTTGIAVDVDVTFLTWIERPGTLVQVMSPELGESAVLEIAEGLRRIDEGEWKRLYATAERHELPRENPLPAPGEPPAEISGDSFFHLHPVLKRSDPPCSAQSPAPPAVVLRQLSAGAEVACYEVGRPGLEADDVIRARARPDLNPGVWQVELTLSAQGTARLDALARQVGAGGQLAVVVDELVVSAPVLATASLRGPVVVTGLDEQAARDLARRLGG